MFRNEDFGLKRKDKNSGMTGKIQACRIFMAMDWDELFIGHYGLVFSAFGVFRGKYFDLRY
ncbi:MAG: hypothetical protein LKF31_06505 [Muribaculaceae bacterium]|jgi:N-methylhydantoinase A/oxoprolinase/acetone carboxylase beta subunit|nr:hypothetical protein [Muribaculaceae bacterium]